MSHYIWSQRSEVDGDAAREGGEGAPEDDDEEDETEEAEMWTDKKDLLLFVIDCSSETMFQPINDEGDIPVVMALRCFSDVLQAKLMRSPRDLAGLILFGTRESRSVGGVTHQGLYEFMGPDSPDSERVKEVEALADEIERGGHEFFERKFGIKGAPLTELFHALAERFQKNVKGTEKRSMFVTDNDNPETDPRNKKAIMKRARDLEAFGASLDLFPVNTQGAQFDFKRFWVDVTFREVDADEDEIVVESASEKFEDLRNAVRKKEMRKRSYMRIPFVLGSGFTIGVRGYNLVVEQKKPSFVYMRASGNDVVKSKQVLVCRDTAEPLQPREIKYYYPYGGENVFFTKDEVKEMRSFGEPGLHLLGFKPKSAVKLHHTIKHSTFLYPDETSYTGSCAIFGTLLRRMNALDKVAICRFIPRKNSPPRLVALWPEIEDADKASSDTVRYTGLHLIPLPFADDIRHVPGSTELRAPAEAVETAKRMVKGVRMKEFDPEAFTNPALDRFHSNLAALALNHDEPEEMEDTTLPKNKVLLDKTKDMLPEFNEHITEAVQSLPASEVRVPLHNVPASKKRSRPEGGEGGGVAEGEEPAPKKRGGSDKLESVDDVEIFARAGKLEKGTIPILQEWLKKNNVKARGKKADLIEAIKKHLNLG
ncbi:SPOC like C-terminal domain-containing protein [Hyaloraphidium curvatum]|nr:SPOC like C-terminal domain-containing protein [Hyaloraphidium curvatum]